MMRSWITITSLVVLALVAATGAPAAAATVELVVALNGAAAKQLFVASDCRHVAPGMLKGTHLVGAPVPVINHKMVATPEGEVERLEIELDGKRVCVDRDDVRLDTDEVVQPRKSNTVASGPPRPVGASRGLGEGQE